MNNKEALNVLKSLKCKSNVDVILLAGDICNKIKMQFVFNWFANNYEKTLYISGNHEYYSSTLSYVNDIISKQAGMLSNFYWLDPTQPPITIQEQRFLGGCLWYPRTHISSVLIKNWSDYLCINDCIPGVFDINKITVDYLSKNIKKGDIVVTHMAPSSMSVGKKFINDKYNCFFVNNLESIIKTRKPSYWIHGHMHDCINYKIGETQVIANPRGYTHSGEGHDFNPNLVITI